MARLALLLVAVALLLPAAARSDACSPLDCAPSQFPLAHGTMLAVRKSTTAPLRVIDLRTGATRWQLPSGIVEHGTLVHQQGSLLSWFSLTTGARIGSAVLQSRGAFELVGASQDGSQAVLENAQMRSTVFDVVSRGSVRAATLGPGHWSFDALRGSKLFLIQTVRFGYYVRLFDLAANRLETKPLKGPGENALISGVAFARAASPDGRYLFTLYIDGSGGAMIHRLDLVDGKALCIGLPGDGNFGAATTWALVPDPDGRTLWAISPGYGKVVAIDVAAHGIRRTWSWTPGIFNENAPGTGVLSPDGSHFAVGDSQNIWFISLEPTLDVHSVQRLNEGLGWAPDQSRLWVVGERSRVSSLALR